MRATSSVAITLALAATTLAWRPSVKWASPKPPSFFGPSDSNPGGASPYGSSNSQLENEVICSDSAELAATAPLTNIFAGLSSQEAADVTAFLHSQKSLNLTANANATE